MRGRLKKYEDIFFTEDGTERITLKDLQAMAALPSNEPLTLEELREMDGEPVWIRTKYDASKSFWAIVNTKGDQVESYARVELFEDYWSDWLAYRRKPEV